MADVVIIGRVDQRGRWTAEKTAALLAEMATEGGKVTVVARCHRISEIVLDTGRAA